MALRHLSCWWFASLLAFAAIVSVPSGADATEEYILGVGDKIRLTVFEEESLSGEFEIGASGTVSLPLIGSVPARGLSIAMFEDAVVSKLLDGYLKSPRVAAEVLNYRPFFIEGEVKEPGQYPFVNGITVREAVAIAGGYTYRAREGSAQIIRRSQGQTEPSKVNVDTIILPGDFIKIEERFF